MLGLIVEPNQKIDGQWPKQTLLCIRIHQVGGRVRSVVRQVAEGKEKSDTAGIDVSKKARQPLGAVTLTCV